MTRKIRPGPPFRSQRKNTPLGLLALALVVVVSSGCGIYRNIRQEVTTGPMDQPNILTIMTYNIRVGYGSENPEVSPLILKDWSKKLPPILAAIRSVDPDVLALQEVLGEPQARELATALNMNYAYVAHGDVAPGWWGVALLSKYRIMEARGVQISPQPAARFMLIASVDVGGRPMTITSIHADHTATESSIVGVRRAVEKIAGPVVLIGDFNVAPSDRSLELLKGRFVDTADAIDSESATDALRWETFEGFGRIDYVFIDRQHFAVEDVGIIAREHWGASDHRAYYARVSPI